MNIFSLWTFSQHFNGEMKMFNSKILVLLSKILWNHLKQQKFNFTRLFSNITNKNPDSHSKNINLIIKILNEINKTAKAQLNIEICKHFTWLPPSSLFLFPPNQITRDSKFYSQIIQFLQIFWIWKQIHDI